MIGCYLVWYEIHMIWDHFQSSKGDESRVWPSDLFAGFKELPRHIRSLIVYIYIIIYIYISTMFMYIHWDEYISQAHFIEQFGILWKISALKSNCQSRFPFKTAVLRVPFGSCDFLTPDVAWKPSGYWYSRDSSALVMVGSQTWMLQY